MCDSHNKKDCFEYIDSGLPYDSLQCVVNSEVVHAMIDPTMTLLNFLRKDMKLVF